MQQLILDLKLADFARFETFWPGPNEAVCSAVRHIAAEPGQQVAWVWGRAGSGRSHLLQAAIAEGAEAGTHCAWLPLGGDAGLVPGMLEGMGRLDLLCVDDIDTVAGDSAWERALFNLFEELRAGGGRLLVAAAAPPAEVGFELRDLASRLASGPTWRLRALADEDLLAALSMRSNWRGLDLPEETARFLLRRVERSASALFELLDRLDEAALAEQRRLTVPFVKSVLER